MKIKFLILSIISISLFACDNSETTNKKDTTALEEKVIIKTIVNINKKSFEETDSVTLIADTITYDALIKNPNPEENPIFSEWLKGTNNQVLADILFKAIYDKKLKAYDFFSGKEMTIDSVKQIEKGHKRKDIGKILFTEQWYFDETELKMYKKVNSIMLSYERHNDDGTIAQGYSPGIRVYLNGTKPMLGANEF